MDNKFKELLAINVNNKTEKKNGLTYLSWAFAWEEFAKFYPDATYDIIKDKNGLPYFYDESGAMVYTKVTAGDITREMFLPVMNGANKAMKTKPYEYKTKYGNKTVDAYTMFDINKTIMRCLVKNLAMFGLGLYIYAGEDLPTEEIELTEEEKKIIETKKEIKEYHKQLNIEFKKLITEGVNVKEVTNSIKKHLGTNKVGECLDLNKLKDFYLHTVNKRKKGDKNE